MNVLEIDPALELRPDAILQLEVPEGRPKTFYTEIKNIVTTTTLGAIAEHIRRFEEPGILVTRYVAPPMAEQLKKLNIAFIDTAGNAYINEPPLFVYITGRKTEMARAAAKQARAFRPTGLQVVFALLCLPDLVNTPYRNIAKAANVALGTVGWVMNDLKQLNFLVDRGTYGRKLINKKKLFDTWVETYARELRPKLYIGRFGALNDKWWQNNDWRHHGALLGGEPAAAHLTGYLKPETVTIYGPEDINAFLLKQRLRKAPEGTIDIYKLFWRFNYPWNYNQLTPPLLIYADLLATANDRNIETAKMIYEEYLVRFIRQN
jgi:hypothetical protein